MIELICWISVCLILFGVIWWLGPDTDDTDHDPWGYL